MPSPPEEKADALAPRVATMIDRRDLLRNLGLYSVAAGVGFSQGGAFDHTGDPKMPRVPYEVDVKYHFRARGNNKVDDAPAIQRAIESLPRKNGYIQGGSVFLPPGTYKVKRPIVLEKATNVTIHGLASGLSVLAPDFTEPDQPVLLLRNCRLCTVRDMDVFGNVVNPPSAAIESRSDVNYPGAAGVDIRLWTIRNTFRNLNLGIATSESIDPRTLQSGIRFTAAANSDGNNDGHLIENVNITGFSVAGISIEHSNALGIYISGGRIYRGPVALSLRGGSFQLNGTEMGVDVADLQFLAPQGTLLGKDVAGYYHASAVSNVLSESSSALLVTEAWPPYDPGNPAYRTDSTIGINVHITNCSKKGGPSAASGPALPFIDYRSGGVLTLVGNTLHMSYNTINVEDPRAMVSLIGNQIFNLDTIACIGHLRSTNNFYRYRWARVPNPNPNILEAGDYYEIP